MATITKMQPCCATKTAQVSRAKAELQRLARLASRPSTTSARWLPKINEAKATIAQAKQNLIDHEAEHADDY